MSLDLQIVLALTGKGHSVLRVEEFENARAAALGLRRWGSEAIWSRIERLAVGDLSLSPAAVAEAEPVPNP
jgi:hypothetical protein